MSELNYFALLAAIFIAPHLPEKYAIFLAAISISFVFAFLYINKG